MRQLHGALTAACGRSLAVGSESDAVEIFFTGPRGGGAQSWRGSCGAADRLLARLEHCLDDCLRGSGLSGFGAADIAGTSTSLNFFWLGASAQRAHLSFWGPQGRRLATFPLRLDDVEELAHSLRWAIDAAAGVSAAAPRALEQLLATP